MTPNPPSQSEIVALSNEHPVVFFDGVCGLCNGTVDWIMSHDPNGYFRFATLQGSSARAALLPEDVQDLNSIVLLRNGVLHRKSTAALLILSETSGLARPLTWLGSALLYVPRPIRDFVYGLVATNRYKWFGKRETCRLPSRSERKRFLD